MNVATMYVDTTRTERNGETYVRHLLRTSYRENRKVKHKTIANISECSDAEIAAIKLALQHKDKLGLLASFDDIEATSGKRVGAAWVLKTIAERVGVVKALGLDREAKLALFQIIARSINQGSRLSAVRLAQSHAICEILKIDKLDEDDLYGNLKWLADHQERIEKKLFALRFPNTTPTLFLYDVTSSYFEGEHNELAQYGYNRDRKKGKLQIVVGLLAGPDGLPVAVRVFEGNTNDTQTVSEQIRILADSFGIKEVTLVGDRGMIKRPQIEALPDGYRYITAIAKPEIRRMLTEGIMQMELFSDRVCEIETEGVRYVLRRNPIRAAQIAESRESKLISILKFASKQTKYLAEHPKANAQTALSRIAAKIARLKANAWLSATEIQRTFIIVKDDAALLDAALLDGCYAIKSDVSKNIADAQTLHDRYCDLENIERSFRTMKTAHLKLRPIFVLKKKSTKGHVFVVMLALLLQRELERCWSALDISVAEGIDELGAIQSQELHLSGVKITKIPKPNKLGAKLLEKASVSLPSVVPHFKTSVHTKKKLSSERYI